MQQQIFINEIYPNPETGSEWIEFLLNEDLNVNFSLLGYTIFDSYHQIYKFTDEQFTTQLLVIEVSGLNNDQDSIILKDETGNILDSFTYTQTQKGLSWSKNPNSNSFELTRTSRGESNQDIITTPTPSILKPVVTTTLVISPSPSTVNSLPQEVTKPPTEQIIETTDKKVYQYDLNKIKLKSENSIGEKRQLRLVFLGKEAKQAEIVNVIIGSLLIILSSLFLIYVKIKTRNN